MQGNLEHVQLLRLIDRIAQNDVPTATKNYRGAALVNYLANLGPITPLQEQVLLGILLGDGTLRVGGTARNCYFKYDQKFASYSLVNLVYLIFEPFVGTPPAIRFQNGVEHSLYFRTFRLPQLFSYYNQFYTPNGLGNRVRRVPQTLFNRLTPISLAFWFMDDGSKAGYGYVLHTESFSLSDCQYLQGLLGQNFNLRVSIWSDRRSNGIKYKLYIKAASVSTFTNLIKPYIIPCMQYKLHILRK